MKTINKKFIIEALSKKVGLSKRTLQRLVDQLLEEIKKDLELGNKVKITKFGIFVPYKTKKKKARNLRNQKELEILPFKKVAFYLSPQFKAKLRNET